MQPDCHEFKASLGYSLIPCLVKQKHSQQQQDIKKQKGEELPGKAYLGPAPALKSLQPPSPHHSLLLTAGPRQALEPYLPKQTR